MSAVRLCPDPWPVDRLRILGGRAHPPAGRRPDQTDLPDVVGTVPAHHQVQAELHPAQKTGARDLLARRQPRYFMAFSAFRSPFQAPLLQTLAQTVADPEQKRSQVGVTDLQNITDLLGGETVDFAEKESHPPPLRHLFSCAS